MANNWHPAVAAQGQGRQERLLRTDQAADKLNCDASTVRRLCRHKILLGFKSGLRKWLIPESALREFIDALNRE